MDRVIRLALPLLAAALFAASLPATYASSIDAPVKRLVKIRKTDLGPILVNGKGFTLYYWEQEKPGKIKCTGGCAEAWPPLLVPHGFAVPRTMHGMKGMFGSVRRPDGKRQVTFKGRALYLYQGDEKPGDTKCQAIEDWYVIRSNGNLTGPSN